MNFLISIAEAGSQKISQISNIIPVKSIVSSNLGIGSGLGLQSRTASAIALYTEKKKEQFITFISHSKLFSSINFSFSLSSNWNQFLGAKSYNFLRLD